MVTKRSHILKQTSSWNPIFHDVSSFSIRTILSEFLDLSEKQDFRSFQIFLLSVTSLMSRFALHFVLLFFSYKECIIFIISFEMFVHKSLIAFYVHFLKGACFLRTFENELRRNLFHHFLHLSFYLENIFDRV